MSDLLFCAFYVLLFSAIIMRSKLFSSGGLGNRYFLGAFYLKLLFGLVLWYIYAHIYKNRISSDVFKYYDDSKIIFATLHSSVKDYLTLITGIGDSGNYYQDIYHSMNSWGNGYGTTLYSNSHFIIRINALFMLLSHGHYGVHVVFMCFISLAGLTLIYKAFVPFLQDKSKMLFVAIFLFPSVLLWSSGILKEGFVWLGLGLCIYYFFQLIYSPPNKTAYLISYSLYLLIGTILLYESKAYVLLCILPCFVAQFFIKKTKFCEAHPLLTYVSVLVFYAAGSTLPHSLFHNGGPFIMISDKQTDFNRISRGGIYLTKIKDPSQYVLIPVSDSSNVVPLNPNADSLLHKKGIQYLVSNAFCYHETKTGNKVPYMLKKGTAYTGFTFNKNDTVHLTANDSTAYCVIVFIEPAKSRIFIIPIRPNLTSLLTNIPEALKISMLLPYPWDVHSAMTAIYCAENMLVLLLLFFALLFIKKPVHIDLILFCLTYCLMMLILIGLVTPILGGIERYKSVVIPFMFILLLLVTDQDKIVRTFKLKK